MDKKQPTRQCIGCSAKKEKKMLLRIIRSPEGEIRIDASGRASGRGAYLCNDVSCLEKAIKRHALSRSLKTDIPPQILEKLKAQLAEGQDGE